MDKMVVSVYRDVARDGVAGLRCFSQLIFAYRGRPNREYATYADFRYVEFQARLSDSSLHVRLVTNAAASRSLTSLSVLHIGGDMDEKRFRPPACNALGADQVREPRDFLFRVACCWPCVMVCFDCA